MGVERFLKSIPTNQLDRKTHLQVLYEMFFTWGKDNHRPDDVLLESRSLGHPMFHPIHADLQADDELQGVRAEHWYCDQDPHRQRQTESQINTFWYRIEKHYFIVLIAFHSLSNIHY